MRPRRGNTWHTSSLSSSVGWRPAGSTGDVCVNIINLYMYSVYSLNQGSSWQRVNWNDGRMRMFSKTRIRQHGTSTMCSSNYELRHATSVHDKEASEWELILESQSARATCTLPKFRECASHPILKSTNNRRLTRKGEKMVSFGEEATCVDMSCAINQVELYGIKKNPNIT